MVRLKNTLFGTEPIVAHCPGPLHEGWHCFANAVLSAPVAPHPPRESLELLTWNNGPRPEKPNGLMEECVARHGCRVHVLGKDIVPWSCAFKLRLTAEALQQVRSEFVIGLDSGDVLLVDHPDEVVSRFRQHFACDLLFNATGSRCWPERPEFVMFERSLPGAADSAGRCWLNAGAFVGRTEFCRTYFSALADLAGNRIDTDDQFIIKQTWPAWYPRVQLDYRCQIFQWFNESRQVMHIERTRADRQLQLIEWLSQLPTLRFGVEVGVFDGYTSDVLLQEFPDLLLWMVDPWLPIDGVLGCSHLDAAGFEQLRRVALWWTSHAEDRRFELRQTSTEAAAMFAPASLDFAFVDADHRYEAVRDDLTAWWPRICDGGLLCGHDYGVYGDATGEWGVRRAVDEFSNAVRRKTVFGRDGTWYIRR
jgi:predicted O-methyltransferase YrrM